MAAPGAGQARGDWQGDLKDERGDRQGGAGQARRDWQGGGLVAAQGAGAGERARPLCAGAGGDLSPLVEPRRREHVWGRQGAALPAFAPAPPAPRRGRVRNFPGRVQQRDPGNHRLPAARRRHHVPLELVAVDATRSSGRGRRGGLEHRDAVHTAQSPAHSVGECCRPAGDTGGESTRPPAAGADAALLGRVRRPYPCSVRLYVRRVYCSVCTHNRCART